MLRCVRLITPTKFSLGVRSYIWCTLPEDRFDPEEEIVTRSERFRLRQDHMRQVGPSQFTQSFLSQTDRDIEQYLHGSYDDDYEDDATALNVIVDEMEEMLDHFEGAEFAGMRLVFSSFLSLVLILQVGA
jgi:hypothetical protein